MVHEEIVILCARQYGKSHLGVILAVEDCIRYPGTCILVIGPTIQQTVDIVAPRLRDIAVDAPEGMVKRSKSENKWYIGKSELVIGGFDANSSSQRGKTVQNIYIEEVVDSRPDDYMESMRSDLGPALTHSKAGKMIFLTTPPKIPDHPFIVETMAKAEIAGALFCFTIDDNKALSQEQYDACVRRAGGKDSIEFQREYLCRIVRDSSVVVVPSFDSKRHVQTFNLPTKAHWHTTTDWGGVRDKTAAILHCYDYLSDEDLILDERIFEPNTPTHVIVAEILAMEKGYEIHKRFADVPGQIQVDLQAAHSFSTTMPVKDDWQAGINQMNVRFAQNKVRIHPRCKFLIMSLQSGMLNRTKTDFERTSVLGHCDALAALSYGMRSRSTQNPYGDAVTQFGYVGNKFIVPRETHDVIEVKSFGKPRRFGVYGK